MLITKPLQKLAYDVLSNKYNFAIASLLLVSVLLCSSHLGEMLFRLHAGTPGGCADPIDVVYTWVNGSDPRFREAIKRHLTDGHETNGFSEERFDDKYELKFSLRSLEKYAPWVRHVYIVTNGQIPYWLNLDYEKVTVVSHDEIFLDTDDLPTFSSPAIESNIHRIDGLSDRFVYFNDDIFLGAPTYLEDFVSPNRGYLIYLAWPLPSCMPDCPWAYVGDGQCDTSCYYIECQFDGGDCDRKQTKRKDSEYINIEDDYEPKVDYDMQNETTVNVLQAVHQNISDAVNEHNRKTMLSDKIRRRKRLHKRRNKTRNGYDVVRTHLDAYALSLQNTNRIFNTVYGYRARKVPAHSPIFVDKNIMGELQDKFRKQFAKTAKNKLRSANDMQYSFSYYYYLVDEKRNRSTEEIFDMFDTDESRTWSDREIRTLLTKLNKLPLSYPMVELIDNAIISCSKNTTVPHISVPLYERYIDSKLPTVTKELILKCKFVSDLLIEHFGTVPRYRYEIIKNAQSQHVTFKMLTSNVSDVVSHLDEIRKESRKFVCINDNMDPKKTEDNELVKSILMDFYLSLFPRQSKYELPPEYRNRFVNLGELRDWKAYHLKVKLLLVVCVSLLALFCFYNTCKRRLLRRINGIIFF